jgi:hypothetical protein
MATMDLSNAKKLTGAFDANRANELIALGWILIDTSSGKDESGFPIMHYSLAWFKEDEPKY